jgi:hypothetical protein
MVKTHIYVHDPTDYRMLLELNSQYWSGDLAAGLRFQTLLRMPNWWNLPPEK